LETVPETPHRARVDADQLDDEAAWIAAYRRTLEDRRNRLWEFLEHTKERA